MFAAQLHEERDCVGPMPVLQQKIDLVAVDLSGRPLACHGDQFAVADVLPSGFRP